MIKFFIKFVVHLFSFFRVHTPDRFVSGMSVRRSRKIEIGKIATGTDASDHQNVKAVATRISKRRNGLTSVAA